MLENGELFYVPEGKTIHIRTGNYKFRGPVWLKYDSSFKWPSEYTDGEPIVFLTEAVLNECKQNSDAGDDSPSGDISVSGPRRRRKNKKGMSGDSNIREDSGEIGQSEESFGERRLDSDLRGNSGEDTEIQAGPDILSGED